MRYIMLTMIKRGIMNKITSIFLMLFVVLIANAQLQEEGFGDTSIPTGWTETNTTGCTWQYGYTGSMPSSGSPAASFPSGAAFFDDNVCGSLSQDRTTLTGPSIDLTGVTNAEIEVIYNLQVFGDKGEFIVEVFDGTSWKQVYFQDSDTPRHTGLNESQTIDVSNYVNNTFAVRFIYDDEGVSAIGLGIDHYKLNDTTVAGIEELFNFGFEYSPNPVANVLKLKAKEDIEQIAVYNLLGQQVMEKNPSRSSVKLNMNQLSDGVYIIHVQIEDKKGSFKIIKQ